MRKKTKGIQYAKLRELVRAARVDAEKRAVALMPAGPVSTFSDWKLWAGLYKMQRSEGDDQITAAQLDLLEAEYHAAYSAARLHHVRQRNRMES